MRLYLALLLLFVVGCAAIEPEGSIVLKDPEKPTIVVRQVEGTRFQGCTDVLINSNVPGFQVDAKVVDLGEVDLRDGGAWSVGFAPTGENPRYDGNRSSLILGAAHPTGLDRPLRICVQVTGVDPQALPYQNLAPPPPPAHLYITVCPPMNIRKR
jgi:hypothetical protein